MVVYVYYPNRSAEEIRKEVRATDATVRRILRSKRSTIAFLKKAGFLDAKGKLHPNYR